MSVEMRIKASPSRRIFGVALMVVLSVLLMLVALQGTYGPLARGALLALAIGVAVGALRLWQAGGITLEFQDGCLREMGPEGRILADLDQIVGVDRGALAFKPSNGFLLRLNTSGPRIWVPGVWWRSGKLVGVGGVLPAHQTKMVAEAISLALAQREG